MLNESCRIFGKMLSVCDDLQGIYWMMHNGKSGIQSFPSETVGSVLLKSSLVDPIKAISLIEKRMYHLTKWAPVTIRNYENQNQHNKVETLKLKYYTYKSYLRKLMEMLEKDKIGISRILSDNRYEIAISYYASPVSLGGHAVKQ